MTCRRAIKKVGAVGRSAAVVAIVLLVALAASGCGSDGPWYDTSPEPDLAYLPLGDVAFEERTITLPVGDGAREVDAYLPMGGKAPVVLFLPGAGVVKARYRWIGASLASHGIATFVVQPKGFFGVTAEVLGPLAAIAADAELAGRVDLTRLVLGGHSAGCLAPLGLTSPATCAPGVCAPGDRTPPSLRGLVMLGFHNQNVDADEAPMPAVESPWLVLTGTLDGLATPEKAGRTFERLQDRPATWVRVVGMNHFQLTDYVDPKADLRLADDGEPTIGNKTARAVAATYMIAFAKRVLLDDTSIPEDLGAGNDAKVEVDHAASRIVGPRDHGLPRVFATPVGMPGMNGDLDAADVVASAEYQGDRYLLVRHHVTGAQVWRLSPDGALTQLPLPGGFTGNPRLAGLLGAMTVWKDELWVGVTSGAQGAELKSTGGELWAFDGSAWRPVIARGADADPMITVAAVSGCAAADGDTTATLKVSGASWTPGQWQGAVVDDVELVDDAATPVVWSVIDNTADTLVVQQNDLANDDGEEFTVCEGRVAAGKTLHLRQGTDEPGFGEPWNKGIDALAVLDDKLYVGTALNFEDGAELWVTADGATFERAITRQYLGDQGGGVPISSSISGLGVSSVSGQALLYVGATGIMGYGGRLFALADDGTITRVIDDPVDADAIGLDEAGLGHGGEQVAQILEWKDRLWIATFDFGGFELASSADGVTFRMEMGEGAARGRGWGDEGQLTGRLTVIDDQLWVHAVAFVQIHTELAAGKSAHAWRTADGARWQLVTAHAFGVNAVQISQLFALGGRIWAVASGAALAQPTIFRPLRIYTLENAPTGAVD